MTLTIVSIELKIIVKEIFDHLRSALDYCAREICHQCSSSSLPKVVYFPIVSRNFQRIDFRSRVGKLMPGVLDSRPDLLTVLESFQPFDSVNNNWIADFVTLCNENKQINDENWITADIINMYKCIFLSFVFPPCQ